MILVDDTPCSAAAPGNFLIPHDATPGQTSAQASVATLQDMNPLVTVASADGTPASFASTAANVAGYNLVLVVGQSADVVNQAEAACTEAGVPFLAACTRGFSGWAFANLGAHTYTTEASVEKEHAELSKPWRGRERETRT